MLKLGPLVNTERFVDNNHVEIQTAGYPQRCLLMLHRFYSAAKLYFQERESQKGERGERFLRAKIAVVSSKMSRTLGLCRTKEP